MSLQVNGKHLVCCYQFEANENVSIGKYMSCSMNKYMSLSDWNLISEKLTPIIESAEESTSSDEIIASSLQQSNIAMRIQWLPCVENASNLLQIPDSAEFYPKMLIVRFSIFSNVELFAEYEQTMVAASDEAAESVEIVQITATNSPKKRISNKKPRELYVRLTRLDANKYLPFLDENEPLGPITASKRKYSSVFAGSSSRSALRPLNRITLLDDSCNSFASSKYSTPKVHHLPPTILEADATLHNEISFIPAQQLAADLDASKSATKSTENRKKSIGLTPLNAVKKKPRRIRPMYLCDSRARTPKKPANKMLHRLKATTKPKASKGVGKKKKRIISIQDDSSLFEEKMPETTAIATSQKTQNIKMFVRSKPLCTPLLIGTFPTRFRDLKCIGRADLERFFETNYGRLMKMFDEFHKQTVLFIEFYRDRRGG